MTLHGKSWYDMAQPSCAILTPMIKIELQQMHIDLSPQTFISTKALILTHHMDDKLYRVLFHRNVHSCIYTQHWM